MKQAACDDVRDRAKLYFDLVESAESMRVLRNGKSIADIVAVATGLPWWKRRAVQPLMLDGVSISRVILEERESGTSRAAR